MNLKRLNYVLSELSLNDLDSVYTITTQNPQNTQNIRREAARIILLLN